MKAVGQCIGSVKAVAMYRFGSESCGAMYRLGSESCGAMYRLGSESCGAMYRLGSESCGAMYSFSGRWRQVLHAKCYTACSILLAELICLCQALNRATCDCATGCTINKTVLYTC